MKKVFLNAYLNRNLGDDLFVWIICSRYKNVDFNVMTHWSYKRLLPQNVKCTVNTLEVVARRVEQWINIKFFPKNNRELLSEKYFKNKRINIAKQAPYNVYVIGSGFVNNFTYTEAQYEYDKKYFNCNPFLLGCNFGPYKETSYYEKFKEIFKGLPDICFRDSYSYNLFSDLSNARKEADIVFAYDLGTENIIPDGFGEYCLISVVSVCKDGVNNKYEDSYIRFIRDCAEVYISKGKKIVFVGFCKKQHDDYVIDEIVKGLTDKSKYLIFNYPDATFKQIVGLFEQAEEVIASRYHAMVLSMLYKKITYVIAYDEKTKNVLSDIDSNAKYIDISDISQLRGEDIVEYGYKITEKKLQILQESARRQFSKLDNILKNNYD